jgi:hypothetical protein
MGCVVRDKLIKQTEKLNMCSTLVAEDNKLVNYSSKPASEWESLQQQHQQQPQEQQARTDTRLPGRRAESTVTHV